MASFRDLYSNEKTKGLDSNFGVDFVINYKIPQDGNPGDPNQPTHTPFPAHHG